MSKAYISPALRAKITEQAKRRCGYCQTTEELIGAPMDVEHIIPEGIGGASDEDNLWLACSLCNGYKGSRLTAIDAQTGQAVKIFDPRHQNWHEHFQWSSDGTEIIGLTATGRASVQVLKLNRPGLVNTRRIWVKYGLHPPKD